jgi:tetratricopeptide (TPR) repeat protein
MGIRILYIIIVLSIASRGLLALSADMPQDDVALNKHGHRFLMNGEYSKAKNFFEKAIREDPTVKYYHNNLSVVYMNQGKYNSAYNQLKIAIALDRQYVKALSNMAITCFHLFRFREAYAYYQKARATDEAYTDNRFQKAKVIKHVERFHAENPDDKRLLSILDYLKKQ